MNKVMLIGNVGKEPEVRYVDQGQPVARLTLATTERGYTLYICECGDSYRANYVDPVGQP